MCIRGDDSTLDARGRIRCGFPAGTDKLGIVLLGWGDTPCRVVDGGGGRVGNACNDTCEFVRWVCIGRVVPVIVVPVVDALVVVVGGGNLTLECVVPGSFCVCDGG